jgi:CTP-dependent riboflavin kinase
VAPDRDEDTGRFSSEYSRESFLEAIRDLDVATTSKVAENVDCSYDLAYRRLQDLEESGSIYKQEVGNSFVWIRKE